MGRKRKWKTQAERQKAYRIRQKIKQELEDLDQGTIPERYSEDFFKKVSKDFASSSEFRPELVDTRKWPWPKYALFFFAIQLTWFQVLCLNLLGKFYRLLLNIPRRHGKTWIIIRLFIIRKLCETALPNSSDDNFCYISSTETNVSRMIFGIASELATNERIIENYGYLVESAVKTQIDKIQEKYGFKVKRREEKQTQYILNLKTRKRLDNYSLYGITIQGKIRGTGYDYVFIDDPVDTFHTVDESGMPSRSSLRKITKKIINMVHGVIYPLARKNISLIGTRYDTEGQDVFTILASELDGRVWQHETYKAFIEIGEYEVREGTGIISPEDMIIEKPETWKLLAPEIWDILAEDQKHKGINCTGLQYAVYTYHVLSKTSPHFYSQEYQNDPKSLSTKLRYEWINTCNVLPVWSKNTVKVGIFVDTSSGEGKLSDYNGITCVLKYGNDFYIKDMIHGRWTPKKRQIMLENFVKKQVRELRADIRYIRILIETVHGQRDFFMRIRDESTLNPFGVSPAGRGQKEERILNGLGNECQNSHVYLYSNSRSINQLRVEMDSFPSKDNHLVDSLDQNIYYLKWGSTKLPVSGETTSQFKDTIMEME